ncbi:hypothetical protein HYG81_18760 [Natrinema zhouii]|nr:hypothetical protein [Natrinema zhouii]UHQ97900.1 hypothetical protein HYG81_18760 [Natrinema zhouii]
MHGSAMEPTATSVTAGVRMNTTEYGRVSGSGGCERRSDPPLELETV